MIDGLTPSKRHRKVLAGNACWRHYWLKGGGGLSDQVTFEFRPSNEIETAML